MMDEGEMFPYRWKYTEGVALSGIKTSSGRTSGETSVGAEGARPKGYNLSGKRTELKEMR
jgi:hypothetical protein